jgi:thioredoxin-related protein
MIRSRRGSIANAALVAILFLGGVALALAFQRKPAVPMTSADTIRGDTAAPLAVDAMNTSTVKDVNGRIVPLITDGEPAIIMISSRTCAWCKRTLADLRELSAGRPLTRLKLITLEGADEGTPMVQREKLNGVQLLGPVNGQAQVNLTFRYQGTPTFIAVDRRGRMVQMMPGYPMREVLKLWYNVMVGDSEVP